MRKGTLYHKRPNQPLSLAVHLAKLHFKAASHTNGHIPVEARFSPCEAPGEQFIDGLVVCIDSKVPLQHIRIVAEDTKEDDE